MGKNIYLIVGPSGVGKTTLVETLAKERGLKTIESYTTRPPRYAGETRHIFVSEAEFDKLGEIVAYTEYNGFRYGVTPEIINTHDLYVIDPYGVEYMQQRYQGPKGVYVIGLVAEPDEIRKRMKRRGDNDEQINQRMQLDAREFDPTRYKVRYDYIVHADTKTATADAVWEFIQYHEKNDPVICIYQINPRNDVNHVMFAGSDYLKRYQTDPDGRAVLNLSIYDVAWAGSFEAPLKNLDTLFAQFNSDRRPNTGRMRSLSVSDIVEISHNQELKLNGRWFCDSFGWKKVSSDGIHFEE